MGNFFSDLGKSIGKAVKGIANVASVIPGPWQVPAQVISVLGAATSKQKNPADTAAGMIQQGADAQTAYQMAALKQQQELMDRQLGTATADKQMAYDINRQQFLANQQNILPYQMASLSALQALPQLQQLLGMQAYNLPQSIAQFTPPEVNYAQTYQQTQQQLFPDSTGAAATEPATGLRVNIRAPEMGTDAQGSTTNQALSAYTGPAYDLNNSPLYLWQKQQAEEALTSQLAAAGLSGGTYAQRELSRQNQGLAAAERERVVGNLTSMVNMGMGGANLSQASFTTPQSTDIMNAYQTGGNNISNIYGNLGHIQGQLGSQLAQNYMAGYNAQQQQTSPIQDALALASSYGWLGGNKPKTTAPKVAAPIDYGIPGYTGWQQYSGMKLL
jgi:hypothetical protein